MDIRSFEEINKAHYLDEEIQVKQLLKFVEPKYNNIKTRIYQRAEEIVNYARNESKIGSPIENLLQEFQLFRKRPICQLMLP